MSQNSRQAVVVEEGAGSLRLHWRGRPDVFVGADQFVYWSREKSPTAPDVFVAFGVPNRHRSSYVVWEEGKPPDFVLEVVSPSSQRKDKEDMPRIYAQMGVPEYFRYDPQGKLNRRWRASYCAAACTDRCRRRRCRVAWPASAARS